MNHYHLCGNHLGVPVFSISLSYRFKFSNPCILGIPRPLIQVSSHFGYPPMCNPNLSASHFGYPPNLGILAFQIPRNIPVFWCHPNLSVLHFGCFLDLSIPLPPRPHILNPCAQVPGDVDENTDSTLIILQPLKPALQLDFFLMFSLFQFVATSLKIVELNCSFYFTTVDHQLNHRSSRQS